MSTLTTLPCFADLFRPFSLSSSLIWLRKDLRGLSLVTWQAKFLSPVCFFNITTTTSVAHSRNSEECGGAPYYYNCDFFFHLIINRNENKGWEDKIRLVSFSCWPACGVWSEELCCYLFLRWCAATARRATKFLLSLVCCRCLLCFLLNVRPAFWVR